MKTTQTARDTRPRVEYKLPDGEKVAVIYDHGDLAKPTISYQLTTGDIVEASLAGRGTYGVVCTGPSGRSTVVSHLTFDSLLKAKRAAKKRNALPQAIQLGFKHRAAHVAVNVAYTCPSNHFIEVA